MNHVTVGVRELKAKLSSYLRQVRDGHAVTITERGRPIGRIVPVEASLRSRMQALSEAGIVSWGGQKLRPMAPVARVRGDKTVADLLLEDRE